MDEVIRVQGINDGTPISVSATFGDVQIGAVEIKDGASDTRATVALDSSFNALYVQSESIDTKNVNIASATLGTVTITGSTSISNTVIIDGFVSVTQATSPWVVDGAVTVTQGTDPWTITGSTAVTNIVTVTGGVNARQDTASELQGQVEGTTAVGAASPNPVNIGGTWAGNLQGYTAYAAGSLYVMPTIIADADGNKVAEINPVSSGSEGELMVGGSIAHDSPDTVSSRTSNPLKIGGRAADYHPDTDAIQGATEVADGDRVNGAFNLQGQFIEGVNARYNALSDIDTTYDDSPTSATSATVECWNYRWATLSFSLSSTSTPTDILFEVMISTDGVNFAKLTNDALGNLIYDDTVCSSQIDEAYTFPIAAQLLRVDVTCVGTDASKKFTVTNATIYLRN